MTTTYKTKIVVGKIGDTLTSEASAVTDELFTSVYDTPVKLAHSNLVDGSVVIDTFTEDEDFTIDYVNGTITVINDDPLEGTMEDATEYEIDYDYNDINLALKINDVVTGGAGTVTLISVTTARAGGKGVGIIIWKEAT